MKDIENEAILALALILHTLNRKEGKAIYIGGGLLAVILIIIILILIF